MRINMIIRKCTINDLYELQQISIETNIDTFAEYNTEENMAAFLEKAFNTHALTCELNEPNSEFYFAYDEDEVIGYMKLNEVPAQSDINDETSLELERIYLRKNRRGIGDGRHLLEYAINLARTRNKKYLWLGVWEYNHIARKFYHKHGFYEFSEHDYWVGDDRQRDILMRIDL